MDQENESELRPIVGEPWPGGIEVHYEEPDDRSHGHQRVRLWLLSLFTGLLVALTAYGMLNEETRILDKVFELVRYGLAAGIGFEIGRAKLFRE